MTNGLERQIADLEAPQRLAETARDLVRPSGNPIFLRTRRPGDRRHRAVNRGTPARSATVTSIEAARTARARRVGVWRASQPGEQGARGGAPSGPRTAPPVNETVSVAPVGEASGPAASRAGGRSGARTDRVDRAVGATPRGRNAPAGSRQPTRRPPLGTGRGGRRTPPRSRVPPRTATGRPAPVMRSKNAHRPQPARRSGPGSARESQANSSASRQARRP
jgi:hypothetical protein